MRLRQRRQKGGRRRGSQPPKPRTPKTQAAKSPAQGRPGSYGEMVLRSIRAHPGIRPSELNRLLKLEQSDGLRNTLIKRGLIRKEKDGSAMRYYPV